MAYIKLIFIFTFIMLTNIINQEECDKANPIKTTGDVCQNIYCDESQYESEVCTIANSIVEKQWLNDIIFFEEDSQMTNIIKMPNKLLY